jgi:hypothetical protein
MNIIDKYNLKIIDRIEKTSLNFYPIKSKIEICIYFYILNRYKSNKKYYTVANSILDNIVDMLKNEYTHINDFVNLSIGIDYLINEKYIAGNINNILKSIDDKIYKIFSFNKSLIDSLSDFETMLLIYYFHIRFIKQSNKINLFIFKELISESIEILYGKIDDSFFDEPNYFSISNYKIPLFLYIMNEILTDNIEFNRINYILKEYKTKIFTNFPLLHSNRLLLLFGLMRIYDKIGSNDILEYINLLRLNINIEKIINEEFGINDIFINNGLSLIYILVGKMNDAKFNENINSIEEKISKKIIDSEAWIHLENNTLFSKYHEGIVNGYGGVILMLVKNNIL